MRKTTYAAAWLLFLLGLLPTRGSEVWSRLKLGMTPVDAYTTLGHPMLRTAGHGFETWTYDDGAELLIHGSVIGWTSPLSRRSPGGARHVDVWSARPGADYFPTFLAAIPPPPPVPPPDRAKPEAGETTPAQRTFLPFYVLRRR